MIRHKNIYRDNIIRMEHPYRVHSSIGFGFLQLLMLSSLAYPTPPPPFYHNIALMRMMGTVYFTLFNNKPIYLKLECATILLEVIRDALYIKYIIQDYTYIFSVIDIVSNLLFCIVIGLSVDNGIGKWSKISERFEGLWETCLGCCFKKEQNTGLPIYDMNQASTREEASNRPTNKNYAYTSLSSNTSDADTTPVYTFGGRQAFKPQFYSSPWGREYLNAKIEREFDRIDVGNERNGSENVGMISKTDGTIQYIRFDEQDTDNATAGANHYANIFVSPYFAKDGTRITSFTGWTKVDSVGVCLFIYNLIQFIYQLLIYYSIITSCRAVHTADIPSDSTDKMKQWLC